MPLIERVAEIRERQRRVEERVSIEEARVREVATKFQEQARAANLDAFNKFEQGLGLKKSLEELAEAGGLESPQIRELVKGLAAEEVELRLKWQGKPEFEFPENVLVERPRGFFSISIKWSVVDGSVIVSGEKEVGSFHESLLNYGLDREDFEESVAEAYLNPRWNEEHDQIMFQERGLGAPDHRG